MRRAAVAAPLAAAAAGLVAWAAWIEPRRTVVRHRTLTLPFWPAGLDGLRVALVADLHAGGPHVDERRVAEVAALVAREHADLVLLLGDFVDPHASFSRPVTPEAVAAPLGSLGAPLGVVAVLGNHDWKTDGPRVAAALRDSGATVLENDATCVRRDGTRLWIAGVGDLRRRGADLVSALNPVPDGEPVLLLSHDPDVFPRVPERAALTVSGHTHGGQINVPRLRAWVIPSRYGDRYAHGHVVENGRHLFVTSGVGTSAHPVRFARPPEVVVLTLRARAGAPGSER